MIANKEIMSRNIRKYMELNNVNASDVCDALGFKHNTFSDWVNAKAYPRIDKIELMANYFHISKANLVEDLDEYESLGTEDLVLLSQIHKLTPANRKVVESTIAALINAQES